MKHERKTPSGQDACVFVERASPWAALACVAIGALLPLATFLLGCDDPAEGLAVVVGLDVGAGLGDNRLRYPVAAALALLGWAAVAVLRSRRLSVPAQVGWHALGLACLCLWALLSLARFGEALRASLW